MISTSQPAQNIQNYDNTFDQIQLVLQYVWVKQRKNNKQRRREEVIHSHGATSHKSCVWWRAMKSVMGVMQKGLQKKPCKCQKCTFYTVQNDIYIHFTWFKDFKLHLLSQFHHLLNFTQNHLVPDITSASSTSKVKTPHLPHLLPTVLKNARWQAKKQKTYIWKCWRPSGLHCLSQTPLSEPETAGFSGHMWDAATFLDIADFLNPPDVRCLE